MSLQSDEDEVKGKQALALLKELEPIFAEIEAEAFRLWQETKEPQARDVIWQRAQGLQSVKDALQIRIDRGQFATAAAETQSRRS